MISLFRSTTFAAIVLSLLQVVCGRHLPVVDLGYELQRASSYNHTGQFYNFSNIRYAAPPVGNLRFSAPQPPKKNRAHVQTGAGERICPQALPNWENVVPKLVVKNKTRRMTVRMWTNDVPDFLSSTRRDGRSSIIMISTSPPVLCHTSSRPALRYINERFHFS